MEINSVRRADLADMEEIAREPFTGNWKFVPRELGKFTWELEKFTCQNSEQARTSHKMVYLPYFDMFGKIYHKTSLPRGHTPAPFFAINVKFFQKCQKLVKYGFPEFSIFTR